LTTSKTELKNQLALYSEKFGHFQDALTRSQGMFAQFEEKMTTMERTVDTLEKNNAQLKQDCTALDYEVLRQLDLKQDLANRLALAQVQKDQLAAECRAEQLRRSTLAQRLGELG
jgi:chromosome segregation ATPase